MEYGSWPKREVWGGVPQIISGCEIIRLRKKKTAARNEFRQSRAVLRSFAAFSYVTSFLRQDLHRPTAILGNIPPAPTACWSFASVLAVLSFHISRHHQNDLVCHSLFVGSCARYDTRLRCLIPASNHARTSRPLVSIVLNNNPSKHLEASIIILAPSYRPSRLFKNGS